MLLGVHGSCGGVKNLPWRWGLSLVVMGQEVLPRGHLLGKTGRLLLVAKGGRTLAESLD